MNKTIKSILALVLVISTVLAVASCDIIKKKDDKDESGNGAKFERGTISSDKYVSDFAGFTFTLPSDWKFLTDSEISQLMGTTSEILDSEDFDKANEASIIDFYATRNDNNANINLSYAKGSAYASLDASITANVNFMKQQYESLGMTVNASDPETVKLGNVDYTLVTVKSSLNGVDINQYCYFKMFENSFACLACTSTGDTCSRADFEAMFS